MKTTLSLALWLALLAPACPGPKPPVVAPPQMRAVAVVVTSQGWPVAGAAVRLDDATPHVGTTDAAGYVLFTPVPASLTDSQLRVEAKGFALYDAHADVPAGNATLTVTLTAAKPPPDPVDVRANFCALRDPGAADAPIFTSIWPSRDDATRARWLEIATAAGDTHYAVSIVQGYGAIDPDHASYYPDRMPVFVDRLRELLAAHLVPIVYLHSGDDWPSEGAAYFTRVLAAIPRELHARCIWVPGWEVVPGGWSTWQLCQATRAIREALGGDALAGPWMALHLGDGRLSFSSHPVESDDPFAGDEIASWRSWYGQQYRFFFYQSALVRQDDPFDDRVPGSTWERAHEVLTRVVGDRWANGPDWFAGMAVRSIPVWWEANEEWYYRGRETRERMLAIAAAARAMGWKGYGAGSPR